MNLDETDFIKSIKNGADNLEKHKDTLFKIITFIHKRDEILKEVQVMDDVVRLTPDISSDLIGLIRDFLREIAMKTTKIYNNRVTNYLKED